jgi:hypothetical protein
MSAGWQRKSVAWYEGLGRLLLPETEVRCKLLARREEALALSSPEKKKN